MALRSLLFCSDEASAAPIRSVLADLGVEGESCPDAATAVQKISSQSLQIVVIDWDRQPEAGLLLAAARERRANERPLTLAIVNDDASVPKALQAGANSILRRPILGNQVKDTLRTARDLLRARQESAAAGASQAAAAAAAAGSRGAGSPSSYGSSGGPLRAGEFLQTGSAPATQLDTESEVQRSMEQSAASQIDPLKDLEPTAASVQRAPEAVVPPRPPDDQPRGLEWYLKRKGVAPRGPLLPPSASAAPAPAPQPAPPKPELIGYDQTPTYSEPVPSTVEAAAAQTSPIRRGSAPAGSPNDEPKDQKTEAQLFAYIEGERKEPERPVRSSFRLGKGAILWATALAVCAVIATPQAPWHPQVRAAWARGQKGVHAWLNPQLVTTPQAPESHENFGRAGDEYKLPVAETIPDATTDPSQIRVTPVIDPTAKKPNEGTTTPDQTAAQPGQPGQPGSQPDGASPPPANPVPAPNSQTSANPAPPVTGPVVSQPVSTAPPAGSPSVSASSTPAVTRPAVPRPPAIPPSISSQIAPAALPTVPPASQASPPTDASIPSSLRTQMASPVPDASGNKPPDTALPSIEPVMVPEAAERALLAAQPEVPYPASAKNQQGTVVLQVLVGRDGTVQDAKFLQGSLAFARAAIDGVRQWKFKPYSMNGRPVSVQTLMTISFKPGA
ncbi:MAG TPA: TonB family protein [Verrucomicrobiae bacterium]|nr:TonB family protein [Verrucomicrobiae bacterium]